MKIKSTIFLNIIILRYKKSPNRQVAEKIGYNSLLFTEQLSQMEKDLEYDRRTIERREEVLSTLELQLTSKNNDDNYDKSPRRTSNR